MSHEIHTKYFRMNLCCLMFCFLHSVLYIIVCLISFRYCIVCHLRFTASDCSFGIFNFACKLLILHRMETNVEYQSYTESVEICLTFLVLKVILTGFNLHYI